MCQGVIEYAITLWEIETLFHLASFWVHKFHLIPGPHWRPCPKCFKDLPVLLFDSISILLPDDSSAVINCPTGKAQINLHILKHRVKISLTFKMLEILPLPLVVLSLYFSPSSYHIPHYPTNWLRGNLVSLCSFCGFYVWQCFLFSVPLSQNPNHSSRSTSGWSPGTKHPLTNAASSRPFYLQIFTALTVYLISLNTLI